MQNEEKTSEVLANPSSQEITVSDSPNLSDEQTEFFEEKKPNKLIGIQHSLEEENQTDPKRVIEAALFIANRQFTYVELSLLAKVSVAKGKTLVMQLQKEYSNSDTAIEVIADAISVGLQVKDEYLGSVSHLSKNVEISKKALKIVALIAKKGKLKQSSLHQYFRGDIYSYVSELKEVGYLSSEKSGNTKILKPTSKFKENFQINEKQIEESEKEE